MTAFANLSILHATMIGLGTIINSAAIVAGGVLGKLFGNKLSERIQNTMVMSSGVCVLFLGIAGTLKEMLVVDPSIGTITTVGSMMAIICMIAGGFIGELLKIESRLEAFGDWLKAKTKSESDNSFVEAFITASLTVSIGAMSVVGAIQDGMNGDCSTLIAKAVLDFIIVMVFASSLGKGAIFSAIPVFVFQGTVTLLSRLIEPLMTPEALSYLSLTGSIMIFCVGINLVWGKKVRVANLLPSIVLSVAWALLAS